MDKKEDKLEGFFKKKLENYSVAEDGWNSPPEFLWKEAKVRFPDRKKKKKKRIVFFIFLGSFIVLALVLLKTNTHKNINNNLNSNKELNALDTALIAKSILESNENIGLDNGLVKEITEKVREKATSNNINENKITLGQLEGEERISHLSKRTISEHTTGNEDSKIVRNSKSTNQIKKADLPIDIPVGNISTNNPTERDHKDHLKEDVVSDIKNIKESVNEISDKLIISENEEYKEHDLTPSLFDKKESKLFLGNRSMNNLTLLPIVALENINQIEINKNKNIGVILPYSALINTNFWAWEFGVSHKVFTNNPLLSQDDIPEVEFLDLFIDVAYSNINFKVEKNLAHNLSFASGMDFSKEALDLKLKFITTYEESLQEEDFRNDINQLTSAVAGINDDAPGEEHGFRLKTDVEINEGDPIEIEANLSALLNVIEIPLMMHYNWRMSKWEVFAGAGIHLNALFIKLNPLYINVYHEGERINIEEFSGDQTEIEYSWDMMGSLGIKYMITPSLNLGLSLKSQIFSSDLRRVELGMYYRI